MAQKTQQPFFKKKAFWYIIGGIALLGWIADRNGNPSSDGDDSTKSTSESGDKHASQSHSSSISELDPTGEFSGNAPMGPSTYIINSDHTYTYEGGDEVNSGTWQLSGRSITFNREGVEYTMSFSNDGNTLNGVWRRQ